MDVVLIVSDYVLNTFPRKAIHNLNLMKERTDRLGKVGVRLFIIPVHGIQHTLIPLLGRERNMFQCPGVYA